MSKPPQTATRKPARVDPRAAVRRDAQRLARRETGHRSFWRSLGVIGMVGWPIAMGAVGGTFAGRSLDTYFQSGIQWTLLLMAVGVTVGCVAAWRSVMQRRD